MSTCTRTYLSTVTKNPVLVSTLRVLLRTFFCLNFNQIGKKVYCFSGPPSSVSNSPHLSFFRLEKSDLIYFFRCQNQNIGIFMVKMNEKGAPLCFDQIKKRIKMWPYLGFFEGKKYKEKQPASSIFHKSGLRNT